LVAQLVLGVVGVLAFSGEYGTGMIRATLAVVPARLPVLCAKLIVLVGLVLPVTLLCALFDFFAATAIESSRGGSAISLTDPGVLRTVIGSSFYLTVIIGLALGVLLRRPRRACRCSPRCSSSSRSSWGPSRIRSRASRPTCHPTPAGHCGPVGDQRACAEPVNRIRVPVRLRGRADRDTPAMLATCCWENPRACRASRSRFRSRLGVRRSRRSSLGCYPDRHRPGLVM
jgi:hypothetical protein